MNRLREYIRGLLLEQADFAAQKIADMVRASAPKPAGDPAWVTDDSRLAGSLTSVDVALQEQAIELMLAAEVPPLAVLDALWSGWHAERRRLEDSRDLKGRHLDAERDAQYMTDRAENNRLTQAIAEFVGLAPGFEPYRGPAGSPRGRGKGWTKEEALASLQDRLGDRR